MINYSFNLCKKICILLYKKINNKLKKPLTISEFNYCYLQCLFISILTITIYLN